MMLNNAHMTNLSVALDPAQKGSTMSQTSSLVADAFIATPASANCATLFSRRRHVLIGISPFNSRFDDIYVTRLIGWALTVFADLDVLLAGNEAANLLEALGTPAERAAKKARRAITRNRRSAESALRAHGVPYDRPRVHTLSDFEDMPAYLALRREVDFAFATHTAFRLACREMSRAALLGRAQGINSPITHVDETMLDVAVPYVLAELPLFLAAADLLGINETLLAYHTSWPLGEQIFNGRFPLSIRPNQGYLVVTPANADAPILTAVAA